MITSITCTNKFGKPDIEFERQYMVVWKVSDAIRAKIPVLPQKIYCHKLMVEPLTKAFKNSIERGLIAEFITWDGCFCIRRKRAQNTLSIHSWGLAIDINAKDNAFGTKPTMSAELVKCFTDVGFEWGGKWSKPDGMHFQLAKI
ncbi:hypothetical protein BWK59_05830 [Flavobacterium davisii]|uniref:Peptidase M15C domain-containing protein n=1 Tax=Flavobacterium davisii TaxID=2906077 RepID=A0A2D0AIJ1_9FLAO|nr:M15 family metallopeptidase [Flavobacterium davisii]OWP84342.1 hypothetical protein BWK59_05830 [Flavobacterium davisii]